MSITGEAIIYGIRPLRPIVNIPKDAKKIKIRMRNDDAAKAFLHFDGRIEEWIIGPSGNILSADTWVIKLQQGVNAWKR